MSVFVFVEYLYSSARRTYYFVKLVFIERVVKTVEYYRFACLHFVECKLTHICVVIHKCGSVGKHKRLRDNPIRRHSVKEFSYLSHTVVLNDYPLRAVLFFKHRQHTFVELVYIGILYVHVVTAARKILRLILFFALFKHKQKRTLSLVKAVVRHHLLYKSRLAALQKSRKKIYRYFHIRLLSVFNQSKKSFASFSSSSLQPITHILPITSLLPVLTSGSPGTKS